MLGDPGARMHLAPADNGRRTAHEFVRETLRKAILRGDLAGGSRLIQADVASQLDVSTTPVREALRDLATEGLITLDRHRGGIVRELNWDDMKEIVSIRQQLEPLAMRLAVERITDAELAEAEACYERMTKRVDLGTWVELNRQFHIVFHEATRSPRLCSMMKALQEASGMYVAQAQRWKPEIRRRANADHRAIIDTVRARDAERAIELQNRHTAVTIEDVSTEPRHD